MTEPSSADQEYWSSPFEELIPQEYAVQDETQGSGANLQQCGPIIGTPEQDASMFDGQQSYSDDCAIRAQEFILEQLTGQKWDEAALVQEAQHNGWYTPGEGGTSQQDIGNLLELHGVPVNRYNNASISDLENELAQGHKPIIFVGSSALCPESVRLPGSHSARYRRPR